MSETTIPKTSEWERAAIKTRVQGGALVFFPPTFSKESRAPPPESAGNPRCRVHPAMVPTELPTDDRGPRPSFSPFLGRNGDPRRAGGAPGALRPKAGKRPAHPKGTQHRAASGRGAGLGPSQVQTCNVVSRPAPGGSPAFSGESRRKERRGPCPLDPLFYGPLVPTRSFWRLWRIVPVEGLVRCPSAYPDLDSHFAGEGVVGESILLQECTTCEGFPLGGSCHRR